MPNHFVLEKDGRIATLTFNRPEKRNPLNEEIVLNWKACCTRFATIKTFEC